MAAVMGSSGGLYQLPDTLSPYWQTSSTSFFCLENSFLWETKIYISIKQLVSSRRTIGKLTTLYCSASQLAKGQSRFTKSLHYMDQNQESIWKNLICGKRLWWDSVSYCEPNNCHMNSSWGCQGTSKRILVRAGNYIPPKYELYIKQRFSNVLWTKLLKAKCWVCMFSIILKKPRIFGLGPEDGVGMTITQITV